MVENDLSLVRPSGSSAKDKTLIRGCTLIVSAFALAAAVCISYGNFSSKSQEYALLTKKSSVGLTNAVLSSETLNFKKPISLKGFTLPKLSFGDGTFRADASPIYKEGSVRNGVKPDFVPPLGNLGDVGLKNAVVPQALAISPISFKLPKLAFGDSDFHSDPSPSRKEGSIRQGEKPDFFPPLGTLGETGLKPLAVPQALATKTAKEPLPRLAFGDFNFQPEKNPPATREGSIRDGVKPDFKPPIGDLGEVGLARKHPLPLHGQTLAFKPILPSAPLAPAHLSQTKSAPSKSSALAFGDAVFVPSRVDPDMREGSVRNGVRPDFKPPIGDLGEVGLKAKVHAQTLAAAKKTTVEATGHQLSDTSSREDIEKFFDAEVRSARETEHHAKPDELTDAKARSGLEAFYEARAQADKAAHGLPRRGEFLSDVKAREGMDQFYKKKAEQLRQTDQREKVSHQIAKEDLIQYYSGKTQQDAVEHQKSEAVANQKAAAAHGVTTSYFQGLVTKEAAKAKEAHAAAAATSTATPAAVKPDLAQVLPTVKAAPEAPKAKASPVAAKGRREVLAYLPDSIFENHVSIDRHGFHASHVSAGSTRKEVQQADNIAKEDLDDCGFTLC